MDKKNKVLLEEWGRNPADVEGQSNTSPNKDFQHLAIFPLFLELLLTMTYRAICSIWNQLVYNGMLTSM